MLGFCFLFFWCLSGFGASSFFLVPANVWWLWSLKTLAGTKKKPSTISQNIGRHQKKQKKHNPSVYLGLWIPIDWKSVFFCFFWGLPMFCEIVLGFFLCLCRFDELAWCWKGKTVFTLSFVLIFIQKSRPHGPQNGRKVVLCQVAVPIKSSSTGMVSDIYPLLTLISENPDCPCIEEVIFVVKPGFWTPFHHKTL